MNLYVIAYPEITETDHEQIQLFRRDHDSQYGRINPHFTIAYPVTDIPPEAFIAEIKKQTQDVAAIPFCIRCAISNKDAPSGSYDIFAVPDEGLSKIVKLHNKLYSGRLAPYQQADITYLPHITIANTTSTAKAKKLTDLWNEKEPEINGIIPWLDVVNYENGLVNTLEKISLTR